MHWIYKFQKKIQRVDITITHTKLVNLSICVWYTDTYTIAHAHRTHTDVVCRWRLHRRIIIVNFVVALIFVFAWTELLCLAVYCVTNLVITLISTYLLYDEKSAHNKCNAYLLIVYYCVCACVYCVVCRTAYSIWQFCGNRTQNSIYMHNDCVDIYM